MRVDKDTGGLQFREEWYDEDEGVCDDERTAKVLVTLANDLEDDIQMTWDTPSRNSNGKMPILDLQLWCEDGKVFFTFFEKSMSSKYVILRSSALSWTTKKMALAGEVCRRLLNTSPELVKTGLAEEEIERLCYRMLISGYNLWERSSIVKEGRSRYYNILKKVEGGERELYREAVWKKEERAVKKIIKMKNWYGDNDSVVFVQSTPGEVLRKAIDKVMHEEGMKVRVVEKGGRTVKSILQKSDINPRMRCLKSDCYVCLTKESGKCWRESVGYEIWCKKCEGDGKRSFMHGETGRTARIRCGEHMENLHKKRGALWEHCLEYHSGEVVDFGCRVSKVFGRDPLMRQLHEASRIECEPGVLMNSKLEWIRPAGVQHIVQRM